MVSAISVPRLNMCPTCLLVFVAASAVFFGPILGQNNVPSDSECYNYKVSFGGLFLQKFYTCCQKPAVTVTESPCKVSFT